MSGIPTPLEEASMFELCGGPGGYSEGARLAGMPPALSVGWDTSKVACETAEKAGHRRINLSIADVDPLDAAQTYGWPTAGHGSPPCPGFSAAGKGKGREDLALLSDAATALGHGERAEQVVAHVTKHQQDPRSVISLHPMRWWLALRPEWITMEQVPSVLPLWEAYAEVLRRHGYSVWTGNITAEMYGVPQTRKRAILMASRVLPQTQAPTPTHSRFHVRSPQRLDPGVQKWVSMAEALNWGMVMRPYPTVAAGTASGGADPQMLGGSGARLIVAREREAGDGHWIEREIHPVYGPVSMLGAGLANDQGQRPRGGHEPSHTITGRGTATWRFDRFEEFDEAGIERPALRNNTSEKAGVRDATEPSPTMYFGGRLNKATWEESEREPIHYLGRFVGFARKYDGIGDAVEIDGVLYRARDLRSEDFPALTVTEKARSWKVYEVDGQEVVGFPREADDLGPAVEIDGKLYRERDLRPVEYPSSTIGKSTRSWRRYTLDEIEERFDDLDEATHMGDVANSKGAIRPLGSPAMTMTGSMDNGNYRFIDAERVADVVRDRLNNQSGSDFDETWPAYRPAAVVAGRDINTAPGANGNRFNGSKKSRNDGVRVLPEEAAALQSFRENYPFQGNKTQVFQQIGDAVPPLMGAAIIKAVTHTY